MAFINQSDPDFRVFKISFDTLVEIQLAAESLGWGTRWSSVEALRGQVREGDVVLQSLMREVWDGVVRSYRCLALFAAVGDGKAGGVATIDLEPARFLSLERIDHDIAARAAFVRMFALAMDGISMIVKE